MTLEKWLTPRQYQMGTQGVERSPIYASCADCGEHDAIIGGHIRGSAEPGMTGIACLVRGEEPDRTFHLAVFCVPCFAVRWVDAVAAEDIEDSLVLGMSSLQLREALE